MENSKALEIIEKNKTRALIYARPEEITAIAPQYEPIVTVLEFKPTDFADVGGGNRYPMKSAMNRIADAAGISYTENCGTRIEGDYKTVQVVAGEDGVYRAMGNYAVFGFAQGERTKPDGKPRRSSVCEYEFNVTDRANLDFIADSKRQKKYYTTLADARKHVLELKKFSTSRASTGAELKVARELAGVPTAFKQGDTGKPMIFSQIVENNVFKMSIARDIMKTPDGRQAMAAALFGNAAAIYGDKALPPSPDPVSGPRNVTPETSNLPAAPDAPEENHDIEEPSLFGDAPTEPADDNPLAERIAKIEEWLNCGLINKPENRAGLQALIDAENPDLEKIDAVLAHLDITYGGAS